LSLKSPPLGHIDVNLPGIDIHAIHAPSGKRSLSLNGLSSTLTLHQRSGGQHCDQQTLRATRRRLLFG
jgi:hypothetical protein